LIGEERFGPEKNNSRFLARSLRALRGCERLGMTR
jgi:hypothetical protein